MSKSKLDIITEKDYKFDLFGTITQGRFDKNNASPLTHNNINKQKKIQFNSFKGKIKYLKNDEKNLILSNENKNNNNNNSSGRSPLNTDPSKLNSTSVFNFRNNNLFHSNFQKPSLQNINLNKMTFYTNSNNYINSTRIRSNTNFNSDFEQYEFFSSLNLSPKNNNANFINNSNNTNNTNNNNIANNINNANNANNTNLQKPLKKSTPMQKYNTNVTTTSQKYFSQQNINPKKVENFDNKENNDINNEEFDKEKDKDKDKDKEYGNVNIIGNNNYNGNGNNNSNINNGNEVLNINGKLNKIQKNYLNNNEEINSNNINNKKTNQSQKINSNTNSTNYDHLNGNENSSRLGTLNDEAIMNSTNKNFEIFPQIVKKENLNKSGGFQEINYYDFPSNKNIPINFEILFNHFPGYESAKSSKKPISDLIKSYAANTYQGLVRYKVN